MNWFPSPMKFFKCLRTFFKKYFQKFKTLSIACCAVTIFGMFCIWLPSPVNLSTHHHDQLLTAMSDLNFSDFYLLHSPQVCADHSVSILVKTAALNANRRRIIRTTWGSGYNVYFLIGRPSNDELQAQIDAEASQFRDILQGSFVDSYRNLTYKSIMGLAWSQGYCAKEYVIKLDDDVIVNPSNVKRFVGELGDQAAPAERIHCAVLFRDTHVQPKGSKHHLGPDAARFKNGLLPTYCDGKAVLYTRKTVASLLRQLPFEPYFWIEDVYETGLLRQLANITEIKLIEPKLINFSKLKSTEEMDRLDATERRRMRNALFGPFELSEDEMINCWTFCQIL